MRPLLLALVPLLLAASPHGDPGACLVCHDAAADGIGAPKPPTATCMGCHAAAARDMHAVGVAPGGDVTVPPHWPLEGGVIGCATCHAEPGCDPKRATAAPFHRGAPYADPQGLCWECHRREDYGRADPHHREGGLGSCAACHVRVPATGAAPRDAGLRLEPDRVCAFCHEAVHPGAGEHLGRRAETHLPLHDGTVACWSCHDVHSELPPPGRVSRPAGDAVRALAGVGEAPVRDGHPPLLALPLDDGALCRACHGAGP